MGVYRAGIVVVLGVALLAHPASASDGAGPAPDNSASSSLRGAPGQSASVPLPGAAASVKRADFGRERASGAARHVADWVVDSGDSRGLPFVIIDKKDARIFVFDPAGRIRGAAPALLGSARGDDIAPGIGNQQLSSIRPENRTTPAGRFVAERGISIRGTTTEDIVWVDYDSGLSLHRVITGNPRERRLERLATATPADNRISYGCINVPVAFYNEVVNPSFSGTRGIVYVLPETRSIRQVFGSYDVEERARHLYAAQAPQNAALTEALPAAE